MNIDGIEYQPVTSPADERLRIVVCDRGFVLVGRASTKDSYVTIRDCSCIRKWGTTKGLGEIAAGGPTTKTVLDPQPTTIVHERQVVMQINCEEAKWNL